MDVWSGCIWTRLFNGLLNVIRADVLGYELTTLVDGVGFF